VGATVEPAAGTTVGRGALGAAEDGAATCVAGGVAAAGATVGRITAAGGAAAVFSTAGGAGAAGDTIAGPGRTGADGAGGATTDSFLCVIAFRTSPGREMFDRSILVLISSSPRTEREAFLPAAEDPSPEERI
jgi:hypothetical protein